MGFAKFCAGFFGDASNEWSVLVTSSDDFLKQNEATHFVVRYSPHGPRVWNASLVIEAEVSWKSYTLFADVRCPTQIVFPLLLNAIGLQYDLEGCWKHWRISMNFESLHLYTLGSQVCLDSNFAC
jgi:hypothetical protein